MTNPTEIYLQPQCCVDPNVGRLWSEDDPGEDWSDPDCDEESTRYIRADLVNGRIAELEAENQRLIAMLRRVTREIPKKEKGVKGHDPRGYGATLSFSAVVALDAADILLAEVSYE